MLLDETKRNHALEIKILKQQIKDDKAYYRDIIKDYKNTIERSKKYFNNFKALTTHELKLAKMITKKQTKEADTTNENCRMMKAVLRVPFLTKKYHDLIREHNMEEFDSLETVYAEHFN